jgi:peptidoglycan L-alanyl-D-glutamate endopeptidase CwlK
MALDPRSEEHLLGVRPELVKVIREAATRTKFRVTEGLRTPERQALLVSQRKSKTLNSRHITGHAIDFIAIGHDGVATYDMDDMTRVARIIKAVAVEQGVKIQWGGDWKGAWDTPHIELDRKAFPANAVGPVTRAVEVVREPPAAATTGAAVGAGAVAVGPTLPAVPAPPDLSAYTAWRSFGDTVGDLMGWMTAHPILTTLCVLWAGTMAYLPRLWGWLQWQWSSRFS